MAKFEKGNKLGKGRPKGSPNRSSEEMKLTIARAVNEGLDYLKSDLARIRKEDPEKALQIILKLLDYNIPKLKSVDMNVSGEITNKIEEITVNINQKNIDEQQ
jgi:hypothetical protein